MSLIACSPYVLSCETPDSRRGWTGVESTGTTLQQDGVPDTTAEDAPQCKALTRSCPLQQA